MGRGTLEKAFSWSDATRIPLNTLCACLPVISLVAQLRGVLLVLISRFDCLPRVSPLEFVASCLRHGTSCFVLDLRQPCERRCSTSKDGESSPSHAAFTPLYNSSTSLPVSMPPLPRGRTSSTWTPLGPAVVSISLFLPETCAVPLIVTASFGLIPWYSIISLLRRHTIAFLHPPRRTTVPHRESDRVRCHCVCCVDTDTRPRGDDEQTCGSLQDLAHRLRLSVVRFRTSVTSRSDTTAGPRRLLIQHVCSWVYLVLLLGLPSSG